MERFGLVACIEEQLERTIGAEMLPEGRGLPSEVELARRFGVGRTTIREALRRLAARGLVVQHPGRRTRAVAVGEALTLENLAIAMHGEGRAHLERRRLLLEGYFALKRETLVELLAACREHASTWELEELGQACFALRDAARWEENWVAREFELLRLAAQVARRPGHLLLIQSLERAWRGIEARVWPHLDAQAVCQWAFRAMDGLYELDPPALKRELLPLLRACDERLLERLVPVHEEDCPPRERRGSSASPPHVETEPVREELSGGVCTNLSACQTGSCEVAPEVACPAGPAPTDPCCQPARESEVRGSDLDAREGRASSFVPEQAPADALVGSNLGATHPIPCEPGAFPRTLFVGEHAVQAPSGASVGPEYREARAEAAS